MKSILIKSLLLVPVFLMGCATYDPYYYPNTTVSTGFYSNVPTNGTIYIQNNRPYDYYNGNYYRPNYHPNYRPHYRNDNRNHWHNRRDWQQWNNRNNQQWNRDWYHQNRRPPPSVNVPTPPGNNMCSNRGCARPWQQ